MKVHVTVGVDVQPTIRMKQMSAMFDAPIGDKMQRTWDADVPLDERPWQIGAIVGPSGAGKSTVARQMFGEPFVPDWPRGVSIVDAFGTDYSIDDISNALGSVGFNTIPAWMRPYETLSNGERFRCDLARVITSRKTPAWVDEFTSVVDRQTACIGSHAVSRFVRKNAARQLVVASCHYDIVDWLQPDWTLEPATMTFTWRELRRRPSVEAVIKRCRRDLWRVFAPYHYMSAELARSARCFAMYVDERPIAFVAMLPQPVSQGKDAGTAIMRISRMVVLPDWQGLGVAFQFMESMGAAYKAVGKRMRIYPAHPPFIRSARRRDAWWRETADSTSFKPRDQLGGQGRPCGRFEYVGDALDERAARRLLAHDV